MRKFLSLAAAAATVFAVSGAQAQTILVDDFNLPTAVDTFSSTVNGTTVKHCYFETTGTCTGGVGFDNSVTAPSLASQRDVGVTLTTKNGNSASMSASVGGGDTGTLNLSASTGNTGSAFVSWTLPSFTTLPSGSTYFFSVVASTTGTTATTQIGFTFTGANGTFTVADQVVPGFAYNNVTPSPLAYSVTVDDAMKLAGGGVLTMNISGGQGWNLELDQFAFSVPEPTSLALVGLALVGAGVASRRRKA